MAITPHARPLNQIGEKTEDGGWITFGRRRLTHGKTDLSLRVRNTGHTVQQQQNMTPLIPKIFTHQMRQLGCFDSRHRRRVRRRGNHNGVRKPVFSQRILHKVLHFPAALTDHANHYNIGSGVTGEHA